MSDVALRNILDANFRANPEYQLVLFDRLPAEQREALKGLTEEPEFYGVLLSETDGRAKSACRDAALLFFTLARAGRIPTYVRTLFGERANQAIAELVLDRVLQIEAGGQFVGGSEAFASIYEERAKTAPSGSCAQLSRNALIYAQALDLDDVGRLSGRLYFYNRYPVDEEWKRRFPGTDKVAEYLEITSDGENRKILDRRWTMARASASSEGWFAWGNTEMRADARTPGGQTYKLYVSPKPDSVHDAFRTVLEVLASSPAQQFKIGNSASGLLRPDKLVIYFSEIDDLRETAQRLSTALAGCPVHGVPFTAPMGEDDGLLSWGIDPSQEIASPLWAERESWRLWVTNRLAASLLSAKRTADSNLEPWRFAMERMRLDNVDTDTWTPLPSFGGATQLEN